jgi:hypothetical protein
VTAQKSAMGSDDVANRLVINDAKVIDSIRIQSPGILELQPSVKARHLHRPAIVIGDCNPALNSGGNDLWEDRQSKGSPGLAETPRIGTAKSFISAPQFGHSRGSTSKTFRSRRARNRDWRGRRRKLRWALALSWMMGFVTCL